MSSLHKRRGGSSFGGPSGRRHRRSSSGNENEKKQQQRGNRYPEGVFDRWRPEKRACWVNLSNKKIYEQEVYDKTSGEVDEVATSWWTYIRHYFANSSWPFDHVCSATAHRTEPCYGCALRKVYFDEHGEDPDAWKNANPSAQLLRAFAVTIMEQVFNVRALDKEGNPKKSKKGKAIFDKIPEPWYEDDMEERTKGSQFGHKVHWSVSNNELEQLFALDDELKVRCRSCAGHLTATVRVCPNCEDAVDVNLEGDDLVEYRHYEKEYSCKSCNFTGNIDVDEGWILLHECSDCDEPEEGGLHHFDIRIKRLKPDNTSGVIKIVGIRVPNTNEEEVRELMDKPLELDRIFAPAPLQDQRKVYGSKSKTVKPDYGAYTQKQDYSEEPDLS